MLQEPAPISRGRADPACPGRLPGPPSSGRDEPCAYCGSGGSRPLYDTRTLTGSVYQIRRCESCRARFLAPRPTAEELEQAYSESYYGEGPSKFAGPIERVVEHFRGARARRIASLVRSPAAVLDIGCGNGNFLRHLIERGFRGYGVELPGEAANRARQVPGLTLIERPLRAGDFPRHSLDAVTLWHVFEHLPNAREVLDLIGEILRPGGYLALSLPNIDSWQAAAFGASWFHLDPPRHLVLLGPDELAREVRDRGFEVVSKSFFSLEQNPFGIQQSFLNSLIGKRDVLYEALKGNRAYVSEQPRWSLALQKLFFVLSFPPSVALAALEAAFGRGGTMELVFRKRTA